MKRPDRRRSGGRMPRWLRRRSIGMLAGLLTACIVAVAAGFLLYQRSTIEQNELRDSDMYARVLEDQVNRGINAVDTVMASLGESLLSAVAQADTVRLHDLLQQAQLGLPLVRSMSLVDASRQVVASSVPDLRDARLPQDLLAPPPAGQASALGALLPGRDLLDAAVGAAAPGGGPSPWHFLPMIRRLDAAPDRTLLLVAVLNLDYFANEFVRTLDDPMRSAALLDIHGQLLAATDAIQMQPGTSASGHRFFTDYLPRIERGHDIGPGIDGARVVTAFRTLRQRPMVVLVEYDYRSLLADVATVARQVGVACAAAVGVVLLLTWLAWRSLGAYQLVQGALERSRERVVRSESELRTLVESVHDVVFRMDARGRIVFVNRRWEQVSGQPGSATLGRRLDELCVAEDREPVRAWVASWSRIRPDAPHLMRLRTAQGELRFLEVSASVEQSAGRRARSYAGMMVDVSERHFARQRLEAELNFSSRLIESNPTPIFVKDIENRFVRVNQAWLELLGLEESQVIGRRSGDLFPDAALHEAFDQQLAGDTPRLQYDGRLERPGQDARDTVVTKVRFYDASGEPAGIIGSIVDVTTFREAERSIRRSRDAAEEANRAKSDFIANISHELRTPLQSIIGFSEIGREQTGDGQPEVAELFDDVLAGGRRMLVLVNDLLDVAKLESSFARLTLARLDLSAVAHEVVREFDPLASGRQLVIALTAGQPLAVNADAFRLQQVLRNVLANALRFAPPASTIHACVEQRDDQAVVTVRDHGPGIPPDETEKIFEAFVQSTRTRDGSGGTGLGLTICRKIMNAHHGTIRAFNAPDGGALIRISLPLASDTSLRPRPRALETSVS